MEALHRQRSRRSLRSLPRTSREVRAYGDVASVLRLMLERLFTPFASLTSTHVARGACVWRRGAAIRFHHSKRDGSLTPESRHDGVIPRINMMGFAGDAR